MKKIAVFGLLVILLVFCFVGCDDMIDHSLSDKEFLFKNQSSYTIVVGIGAVGNSFTPNDFELTPGAEQKVTGESNITVYILGWYRKDTNDETGVICTADWEIRTAWFKNK